MTDPVGVSQDPRRVMLVGDEPDTVAELMALAECYANAKTWGSRHIAEDRREALESAIRSALEAK